MQKGDAPAEIDVGGGVGVGVGVGDGAGVGDEFNVVCATPIAIKFGELTSSPPQPLRARQAIAVSVTNLSFCTLKNP